MKKLIINLALIAQVGLAAAQGSASIHEIQMGFEEETPLPVVRQTRPPMFPGGAEAFEKFVSQTARYPRRAFYEGIEGTLYVEIYVLSTGKVQILKIKSDLGAGCEEEAVRVVSLMPYWLPALQESEPVRRKVRIPFTFKR